MYTYSYLLVLVKNKSLNSSKFELNFNKKYNYTFRIIFYCLFVCIKIDVIAVTCH